MKNLNSAPLSQATKTESSQIWNRIKDISKKCAQAGILLASPALSDQTLAQDVHTERQQQLRAAVCEMVEEGLMNTRNAVANTVDGIIRTRDTIASNTVEPVFAKMREQLDWKQLRDGADVERVITKETTTEELLSYLRSKAYDKDEKGLPTKDAIDAIKAHNALIKARGARLTMTRRAVQTLMEAKLLERIHKKTAGMESPPDTDLVRKAIKATDVIDPWFNPTSEAILDLEILVEEFQRQQLLEQGDVDVSVVIPAATENSAGAE